MRNASCDRGWAKGIVSMDEHCLQGQWQTAQCMTHDFSCDSLGEEGSIDMVNGALSVRVHSGTFSVKKIFFFESITVRFGGAEPMLR